ncbi:helix-turn-helix transcriptional regulator [Agromyces albus]|uniref:helix-turn-helix transcriptional regulator n=1 Tax=Agromyces albus TaxID=205332 RepID=UPI0027D8BA6E|nr:helix-turn-helix transcriptional regulator [Agromyces albus]
MTRNAELGEFLRACRARLRPEDVGLDEERRASSAAARRVPGLRREEVAHLAGVSVDYYSRLEQGRTKRVSHSVLNAVATALRLNDTEREYLITLVDSHVQAPRAGAASAARVRPGARRLLELFDNAPAFILGRGTAILAMNELARSLLFDVDERPLAERNLAVWTFLDPEARTRYVDWDSVASDTAAMLRMDAADDPNDPDLNAIVGMLSVRSEDFRRFWSEHNVFECTYGRKRFSHPLVGRLDLDYEALDVPDAPPQKLHVYSAPNGSPSNDALRQLAAWIDPAANITALPDSTKRAPHA